MRWKAGERAVRMTWGISAAGTQCGETAAGKYAMGRRHSREFFGNGPGAGGTPGKKPADPGPLSTPSVPKKAARCEEGSVAAMQRSHSDSAIVDELS